MRKTYEEVAEAEPNEPVARRRPGAPLELLISQDPTQLFNKHSLRREQLDAALLVAEQRLRACKSDGALLHYSEGGMSAKLDRLPTADATGASENQMQFFPRSFDKIRECGNYRDPSFCRPLDKVYLHREAMCRQKHLVTKH